MRALLSFQRQTRLLRHRGQLPSVRGSQQYHHHLTIVFAKLVNTKPAQTLVVAQIGNDQTLSTPTLYLQRSATAVVPVLNLVVQLTNGQVSGFTWDGACLACSGASNCLSTAVTWTDPDKTGTTQSSSDSWCTKTFCASSSYADCDLRLFVSWVGTDSKGKYLESAGYRLSNFQSQNIAAIYGSMSSLRSSTRPPVVTPSTAAQAALDNATR